MWYVYVLRCAKDSLYIGVTENLKSRFREHAGGTGAVFTKRNPTEEILFYEVFDSKSLATERERQLKRWSRAKKQALMAGGIATLRRLSVSYD